MKIAVINSGSSSLKCKIFNMPQKEVIFQKEIENIGEKNSPIKNHHQALNMLNIDFNQIDAVGHRIVHGGEKLQESCLITDSVIETIKALIPLAPLHNKANLEGIYAVKKINPNIPQIAVFDTAFHSTMPDTSYIYALPYKFYKEYNIRRYGFHGISHSYLLKEASKELNIDIDKINLITLHLGNGSSACAIKNGKSIDTSMGFTPLEGLVMGTRCGDIDPQIPIYLSKELNFSTEKIDTILNKQSGLYGICNENDLRKIESRDDYFAKLAIKILVKSIQKYIGAYLLLLERVDAIVFSGGIGEHSKLIRDLVMDNIVLKDIKSLVIKTDEELEIAQQCYKLLQGN